MEKTINFSIFKEKIIKTNELLHLHLQKNRELEKVHKCYQQLKAKFELSKDEIQKFKLKDETLSYNLQLTEGKYSRLQKEHDNMKSQYHQLEKEFSDTVNSLQINYQHTSQELEECKQKLSKLKETELPIAKSKSPLKKKNTATQSVITGDKYAVLQDYDNLKIQFNTLKINNEQTSQELQKCRKKLLEFETQVQNKTNVSQETQINTDNSNVIKELIIDKDKLTRENKTLKLEILELKHQEKCLKDDFNAKLQTEINMKKQDVINLKNNLKEVEANKNQEVDKLTNQLMKNNSELDKLKKENEKLLCENSSFKLEIAMLQANDSTECPQKLEKLLEDNKILNEEIARLKEIIKNCEWPSTVPTRHNSSTPTDQEIEEIMQQVTFPSLLSPLNEETYMEEIVPYTKENLFTAEENISSHNAEAEKSFLSPLVKTKEKLISSSSGNFVVSNISEPAKISNTRKLGNKKKRLIKKEAKKIDLYKTLLALKKANLNFIISNESLPPISGYFINSTRPVYTGFKNVPEKKYSTNNFISKLDCNLDCCKSCHMLLRNNEDENAPLLGFFDVKSEKSVADNNYDKVKWPKISSTKRLKKIENGNKVKDDNVNKRGLDNKNNESVHQTLESENQELGHDHLALESENEETGIVQASLESVYEDTGNVHTSLQSVDKELRNVHAQLESVHNDNSILNNDSDSQHEGSLMKDKCKITCNDRKRKRSSITSVINNIRRVGCTYVTKTTKRFTSNNDDDNDNLVVPFKKRIAHVPRQVKINNDHRVNEKCSYDTELDTESQSLLRRCSDDSSGQATLLSDEIHNQEINKLLITQQKSPNRTFKRPICSTRRSPRLQPAKENVPEIKETTEQSIDLPNNDPPICPRSPTPSKDSCIPTKPKIIPLEKVSENVGKMPPSKIVVLFSKLINYSMEEEALNEVVREFLNQDPEYIAQAIIEKISYDIHDAPDTKYYPAPLMTLTQRVMLGFMSKLEKLNVIGVFDSYLTLAEHRLLTRPVLQEIAPITRLYLAICKLHHDLHRMRKLCCDVFYFCGDFAVPFLFYVLTSWTEVLPHEVSSKDMPLAKVLVQIVYMKDCNKPGYNLMPLRDLLIKFYGYPSERWDSNELFQELFHAYLRNPLRSSDFALLLFCKNHPENWVHDKVEEHLKPLVHKIPTENFKATVIILIGNLYHRFNKKSDNNYLASIREWLTSLVTESTPDVVKRSVYLCLNRLAKK